MGEGNAFLGLRKHQGVSFPQLLPRLFHPACDLSPSSLRTGPGPWRHRADANSRAIPPGRGGRSLRHTPRYPGDHTPGRKARCMGGAHAWMLEVREAAALAGAQTGHGDGGGCEGLEMGQAVPLTVPRRRREKRAGAWWGLEGEEVKKPGSHGRGNVCASGGRKGRVRGAAGDEGRGSCPGSGVARLGRTWLSCCAFFLGRRDGGRRSSGWVRAAS